MWYRIQLDQIWYRQYEIGSDFDTMSMISDPIQRVRYRWYQIQSDDLISLIPEPVRADLILVISDPTRSDPTLPPIRPPDNLIADHSHYAPYGTINPPPIHQLVAIFALKQNTEISVFLLEQVYCMNTGVLYRRCALRKFSFLFSLSLRPTPYFKVIAWKNYHQIGSFN